MSNKRTVIGEKRIAARVADVIGGSPADVAGVRPGDDLLAINGVVPRDVIDYQLACLDDALELTLLRDDAEYRVKIDGPIIEPLGIRFDRSLFDLTKTCVNDCVFCFIDQLPPSCRSSLNIKDDDFRLSFLYGNFITLTNLTAGHIKRIVEQRLSPLYISLHSVDDEVRRRLVRTAGADRAMESLGTLLNSGIEVHVQIVLCPGYNDGAVLDETIASLVNSGVASIGIVPVGLTGHRDGLTQMEPVTPESADALIDKISGLQTVFLRERGSRSVFLADEFYLMTGKDVPSDEIYEDYPQLENGIGLTRFFLEGIEEGLAKAPAVSGRYALVTSTLATPVIEQAVKMIAAAWDVDMTIVTAANAFLGGGVSITGLLSGSDIAAALDALPADGREVLLPDICLNIDGLFIDDLPVEDLVKVLGRPLTVVPSGGGDFIEFMTEMARR